MNFKDIINDDLDIFINLDEFAQEIQIDGFKINGVISSIVSEKNKLKLGSQGGYGYGEAIYVNEKEISFKTLDCISTYKQGDRIEVNHALYEVVLSEESDGMTTLVIGEQGN